MLVSSITLFVISALRFSMIKENETLRHCAVPTPGRSRSLEWFGRAQQVLIEGVNSPSRGAAVYSPAPIFLERGAGTRVWDADGNEYTDFMMSFGALIHAHAHPKLVEVVSQAMAEGSHFASATSAEVEAAERFRRMVLSAEAVRFTNTGSEATRSEERRVGKECRSRWSPYH